LSQNRQKQGSTDVRPCIEPKSKEEETPKLAFFDEWFLGVGLERGFIGRVVVKESMAQTLELGRRWGFKSIGGHDGALVEGDEEAGIATNLFVLALKRRGGPGTTAKKAWDGNPRLKWRQEVVELTKRRREYVSQVLTQTSKQRP
jgi:hypothetical protein